MKALFIIHCQDPIYGASRSVGNLVRNLDADVDIIFPVKIKNDGITAEQIAKYYGPRVKNVWFLPQPERLTVQVESIPIKKQIKSAVKEFLYILSKSKYENIYKKGNYDFIHLNSAVLFPMVDKRWPMFLHVREGFRKKLAKWDRCFTAKANEAHGVIYIDSNTKQQAPEIQAPSIVLINPFDQRAVKDVDYPKELERFSLTGNEVCYGIIGNVNRDKGVDTAIRAYQAADIPNSVFLVVGSLRKGMADPSFVDELQEIALRDQRIRLVGEVEDMEKVYRVLDYVVRCDPAVGLGRTVYEALYSGCGVILQNDGTLNQKLPNTTSEMQEKVFFYKFRNEGSLVDAYRNTNGKRMTHSNCYSNVEQYVKTFQSFIQKNIYKKDE